MPYVKKVIILIALLMNALAYAIAIKIAYIFGGGALMADVHWDHIAITLRILKTIR